MRPMTYAVSSPSTIVKPNENQSVAVPDTGFKLSWPQACSLYPFHACLKLCTTASCLSFVGPAYKIRN